MQKKSQIQRSLEATASKKKKKSELVSKDGPYVSGAK